MRVQNVGCATNVKGSAISLDSRQKSSHQWRLDIIDSFSIAMRHLKFLIVGIDYFTKWVEAEAVATITEKNI